MNRGSLCRAAGSTSIRLSFNEAPIHESGKSEPTGSDRIRAVIASMRPRFMNRGSLDDHRPDRYRANASMRPRFMNRGSDDAPEAERGASRLQ